MERLLAPPPRLPAASRWWRHDEGLGSLLAACRATLVADDADGLRVALAEQLAWASCLVSGVHVRLSGQDVERGTFSHRHCVVHDQKEFGGKYSPLKHIDPTQAAFNACNSSLSEFAVLGFELGFSLENPASLVGPPTTHPTGPHPLLSP